VEGLVNQTDSNAFLHFLGNALEGAKAAKQSVGLLVVHIENFDRVVSALGFRAANRTIAEVARRLRRAVKPNDSVLRISEAKFAVLINPVRNQGLLVLAASKLGQILARPVQVDQSEVNVVARIGTAIGPEQAGGADDLLQRAETALLTAMTDDQPYAAYAPAQSERATDSLGLEAELDNAIRKGEFELYYQPKISTVDFRPCGAEALLRWINPKRGPISPDIFIPLADKAGRIEPLTSWVLNTAVRQSAEWPQHWDPLTVAVNVTPRVIEDADLGAMVASAVGMWDTVPDRLFIEITEGAIMKNPAVSFSVLRSLREQGVQISIDDFGTGYSSLAYFKNIPADELKIDKSFVINMLGDKGDKQIVRTVIDLAKSFGLMVTAEGVEDRPTAEMLAQLGCDRLQGYFYSKPLPQTKFIEWLDAFARAETPTLAAAKS
jgi:diguanylate cyclase (GGDEF)-like protein